MRWLRKTAIACTSLLILTSCAPGTDGIVVVDAAQEVADPLALLGEGPVTIDLPHIPVIALPDLSMVGNYDDVLADALGALELNPIDGVEIAAAECGDGRDAILEADEASSVFDTEQFDVDSFAFRVDPVTGASHYERRDGRLRTQLVAQGDGSGQFVEEGRHHHLSIEAATDGAGRYYRRDADVITTVEADANGAGVYYEKDDTSLETITIGPDGSGALFSESEIRLMTLDALPNGAGDLYIEIDDRVVTLRVRADRSWEYANAAFADEVNLLVNPDGSGSFRQRGANGAISLEFDSTGASTWKGQPGPQVIVPDTPRFLVADRFPPLGTLASIEPPCGTILRFDSQVLFGDNDFRVLPEAAAVLAEVAPVLIEANRSIEVHGHTDARGSDEHNQTLSEQRAGAVAAELASLGVDLPMTVTGWGESRPVADNFTADGADDAVGQRANRRVEIVIAG